MMWSGIDRMADVNANDGGTDDHRSGHVSDVRKIAVLRANALGDFLVTLPALDALRATYPDAEIILLGRRLHAELLAGRTGPVDRVIAAPPSMLGKHDDEGALPPDQFACQMQAEHLDLAIQLHGGGALSNGLMRQLGARVTAGSKTPDAPALDRWIPYPLWQHEIFRFLDVVALVGARPRTLRPQLTVMPFDIAEAERAVPDDGHPLVVIHPGALDVRRRWPAERFAAVGDALARTSARIVVTGSSDEQALVQRVVDTMQTPAIGLAGQLSLRGLVGLLARSSVLVSNDTGPRHLAEAVGTPTVGIYWCANLVNIGSLSRVLHRALVSWQINCPDCGRNSMAADARCQHDPSFVADIAVEAVIAEALDLLARSRAG
jgi:ADP-heptose:LPS heptosyltransferase